MVEDLSRSGGPLPKLRFARIWVSRLDYTALFCWQISTDNEPFQREDSSAYQSDKRTKIFRFQMNAYRYFNFISVAACPHEADVTIF